MIYDQIDWGVVKMKHLSWRMRFRSMLNGGSGKLEEIQVKDHKECEMGKWLFSVGTEKYGRDSAFKLLAEKHHELHRLAGTCYTYFADNNFKKANETMNEVLTVSDELMNLIDEFKAHVEKPLGYEKEFSTKPHIVTI